jgi:hypothetical protein
MMKRDEIETLLPWYAAGTLSLSDADRVEQALAIDQESAGASNSSARNSLKRSISTKHSARHVNVLPRSCSPR